MGSGSGSPPSSAIENTRKYDWCGGLSRAEPNTTRFPSGVQPLTRSNPGWNVRRVGSPPAVGMTYTSVLPPTVAVNAILDPSGEKYGSVSTVGVAVSRRAWPPARATDHRSPAYSNATSSRLTVGWRRRRVPCADAAPAAPNQAAVVSRTDRAFINRIEFG